MIPGVLAIHHVYFTLKRRGNGRFHAVSTWNTRGLFVGFIIGYKHVLVTWSGNNSHGICCLKLKPS